MCGCGEQGEGGSEGAGGAVPPPPSARGSVLGPGAYDQDGQPVNLLRAGVLTYAPGDSSNSRYSCPRSASWWHVSCGHLANTAKSKQVPLPHQLHHVLAVMLLMLCTAFAQPSPSSCLVAPTHIDAWRASKACQPHFAAATSPRALCARPAWQHPANATLARQRNPSPGPGLAPQRRVVLCRRPGRQLGDLHDQGQLRLEWHAGEPVQGGRGHGPRRLPLHHRAAGVGPHFDGQHQERRLRHHHQQRLGASVQGASTAAAWAGSVRAGAQGVQAAARSAAAVHARTMGAGRPGKRGGGGRSACARQACRRDMAPAQGACSYTTPC